VRAAKWGAEIWKSFFVVFGALFFCDAIASPPKSYEYDDYTAAATSSSPPVAAAIYARSIPQTSPPTPRA
jgi:hypothetical protein